MEKAKYSYIIWDWNGTLYDDVDISLQCVNDMLIKRNMPTINMKQYYSYVDTPIIKFYEHIFDLNIVTYDTICNEYYFSYNKYTEDRVLPQSTVALVKKLNRLGVRQSVVSSYFQKELVSMMKRCGVYDCFEHVSGARDRSVSSKLGRVENAIISSGVERRKCVIVGDTEQEFDIAIRSDIDCVLVGWGHNSPEVLKSKGCAFAENIERLGEIFITHI